jgi:hypothetical protein
MQAVPDPAFISPLPIGERERKVAMLSKEDHTKLNRDAAERVVNLKKTLADAGSLSPCGRGLGRGVNRQTSRRYSVPPLPTLPHKGGGKTKNQTN